MEKYFCYRDLKMHEVQDRDYRIDFRYGCSKIAVMAPHGGGIEPGTTEIADAVAGKLTQACVPGICIIDANNAAFVYVIVFCRIQD